MGWKTDTELDQRTTQLFPHRPGLLYGTPMYLTSTTVASVLTPDLLFATPIYIPKTDTYSVLGFEVTVAAAASSNARLGVYNNTSDSFVPGSLVIDAGTVATDVTGFRYVQLNTKLNTGWYWLAGVFENTATEPTVRNINGSTGFHWYGTDSTGTNTNIHIGVYVAHVYAALPDPFGAASYANAAVPWFKVDI